MAAPSLPPTQDSPATSLLDAQLTRLGLSRTEPPGPDDWALLIDGIEEACSVLAEPGGVESLPQRQVDQRRLSQTSLFDQSPIPVMQLDLSDVEADRSGDRSPDELVQITGAGLFGLDDARGVEPPDVRLIGLTDMVRTKATTGRSSSRAGAPMERLSRRSSSQRFQCRSGSPTTPVSWCR